jgi:hypothetical protein
VHLVILVEMLQETIVDGVQVDDKKVTHGLHLKAAGSSSFGR